MYFSKVTNINFLLYNFIMIQFNKTIKKQMQKHLESKEAKYAITFHNIMIKLQNFNSTDQRIQNNP